MKLYLLATLAFLLACCACQAANGDSVETNGSRQELENNIGKPVSLRGTALDAKAGAVVKTAGGVVYIRGLSAWPSALRGKEVSVEGTLLRQKFIPDPVTSPSGVTSQGALGEQFVVKNARWKLTE